MNHKDMLKYICPNCKEELSYVDYSMPQTDYGTASVLTDDKVIEDDRYNEIQKMLGDYESNDVSSDYISSISCPYCSEEISLNLKPVEVEDKKNKEEKIKSKFQEDVELSNIIREDMKTRMPDSYNIYKCNKCKYNFFADKLNYNERTIECPKCESMETKQITLR